MVMTAVLLSGLADGVSTVTDGEAINKSYPSFYEDFKKIGGKLDV